MTQLRARSVETKDNVSRNRVTKIEVRFAERYFEFIILFFFIIPRQINIIAGSCIPAWKTSLPGLFHICQGARASIILARVFSLSDLSHRVSYFSELLLQVRKRYN